MPDIIILTECWLNESFSEINIDNYKCHYSKIYINQNDGIVIYYKDNLKVEINEPLFKDGSCLVIDIDGTTRIIAIYRSPSFSNIDNFLSSLETIMIEC